MIYRCRMLTVMAVLAVILFLSGRGHAQDAASELPTEPILRIETGKHGAIILRIDTDAANRFAVTASDDKTVRVWSLPEGRLMRVLRLPIDQGDIGKAYAVAISPDGTTVAVGGFTGTSGHINIFLFDRASGELKQRLRDLPNVVTHLAYSPDGRRLVAALFGTNGIRVFDAGNDYRPAAERHAIRRCKLFGGVRSLGTTGHDVVRRVRPAVRGGPVSDADRSLRSEPDTAPIQRPFRQTAPASQSVTWIPTMLWSSRAPT